jgi:hypothetical protein
MDQRIDDLSEINSYFNKEDEEVNISMRRK